MNLPKGLTESAQRERERFEAATSALLEEVQNISLSVLVWGPSPQSDSPVARKRVEIRDMLISVGHNAMFSEDLSTQSSDYSEKTKEFAQARAAHLVIILVEGAPGALAEAHDFCSHHEIVNKVCVMIPKAYLEGYSAKGAIKLLNDGHGGVHWYEAEELEACDVRKHAMRFVAARRELEYLRRGGAYGRP